MLYEVITTGIDPTAEQWEVLSKFCAAKGIMPLFDFAYQGFARGVDEDAERNNFV